MCRISGIVSDKLVQGQLKALVNSMCDKMSHGGPDDSGIFEDVNRGLAFGHRRLSIIDLSKKGHQPMADAGRRAWITFNGEIYNYLELKRELGKLGAEFFTGSDTEVILAAYLQWGTASFDKFRGMFGFALYDIANGKIYLVRDANGIKPLYYAAEKGQLVFASEIKAFKAAGIANQADRRWPAWLLAYGHIPEPYTTLQNVLSLPKGHYLCWKKDGTYEIKGYVANVAGIRIDAILAAQQGIQYHLRKAVKRQLIADAPIGVFLSGGIDSSILTSLANEQNGRMLKTISIYFDEKKYDERIYQAAAFNRINGENFRHLVREQDFTDFLPQILNAMDMPTTDGINSWFISKYAHDDGLKAVLSGIGADELFGGYPSFKRIGLLRYLKYLPGAILAKMNYFQIDSYRRLSYLVHDHPAADYLFLRGLYPPADIAKIMDINERELNDMLFGINIFPHLRSYDNVHASWFETNIYMQNQLLRDTDVMGMSHGLEVRVPFLDEDFQLFCSSLTAGVRYPLGRPKKLLIDSFKSILPETVWKRPKMGFTFPLQEWMKRNEHIIDENYYPSGIAKAMVKDFKQGKAHWSRIFALYQVQQHV